MATHPAVDGGVSRLDDVHALLGADLERALLGDRPDRLLVVEGVAADFHLLLIPAVKLET